ncbi:TonB-dependent receptor [Novosphingobium sp.]|uniref:TonB-dependent receptor n=1 Tax=Novosphingobium sp. TaxID=1874826 RepID=UPI00333F9E6E
MKRPIGILAGVALSVMVTSAVHAQAKPADAAPATGGIQEIVVTAQKRSENVQNVPIAISAFTASALKERGVGDVSALTSVSPNVTFDASTPFSGSSAVLGASIRGVGSADFAFNIDQTVGVYVDGVYLGRSVGANQDLLDVERIEVLKGPQGTLFGRNTIGGAVSIVTHDPGNQFRFIGDVTGGSYRRFQVRGSVDVPIAENLSSSLTFGVMRRDGYQYRLPYPGTGYSVDNFTQFNAAGYNSGGNRQGGDNSYSLRGKLKYTSGSFKATLALDYTNVDQESTANTLLGTTEHVPGPFGGLTANNLGPNEGFPVQTGLDVVTGSSGFLFAGLYNFCIGADSAAIAAHSAQGVCGPRTGVQGYNTLPALAGAGIAGPNNPNPLLPFDSRFITGNPDTSYATGNNYSKVRQYGITLTLEDQLTDNLQIKSISAFRNVDFNAGVDLDGSPLNFLQTSFTVKQHQWSQEFQINGSSADKKLKYTVGAYVFNEAGDLHDYVTFADGLLQVDGPGRINTTALATFGQFDYKFSDLISITVGGRYTHEHKNYYGGQADDNGFSYKLFNCAPSPLCAALTGFPTSNNNFAYFNGGSNGYGSNLGQLANYFDYYAQGPNSRIFNNFSPKAGIQLHPKKDVMAYLSWSRGYRSGGWTTRLSNPLPYAPQFGPEKAETFEIGLKSQLFDRHLQLNLSAFNTSYNGIQLNQQIGVSPTVANLGKARVRGFEAEAVLAPADGLTITGSVGYLDAHFTYICGENGNAAAFCGGNSAYVAPNPLQAGIYAGAPLPKAPHWKMNISPRYEVQLGEKGSMIFLADFTHTTSMRNDTEGTFLLERVATNQLNASVTYKAPGKQWDITAGGTNLTNQRYLITGQAQVAGGEIYGTYNRPAEWYARLSVKF